MPQFLRPDSNITQTSFTGGFADIDEATASDSDFAYGANNSAAATLEVHLSNPLASGYGGTCTVRWRHAKVSSGTLSGTGGTVTQTCTVLEGATSRGSSTVTTGGTWTAASFTFDGSTISDWTNVRLRFTQSSSGGGGNARGSAVSWAELEIPDQVFSITETESATSSISALANTTVLVSSSLSGVGTASGSASTIQNLAATLQGALNASLSAIVEINNGIRFTESNDRRITQNGDVRVLQGYVASGTTFSETLSLSSNLSVALIPTLVRNAQLSLVGSLAQLSASTVSRGAVAALSASGSLSGTALQAKNFIAALSGAGVVSAKGGYLHTVSFSQSSSGQLQASAMVVKDVSSTRNATTSFDFIPTLIRGANSSLSSSSTLSATILGNNDVNLNVSASGVLVASAGLTRGIVANLQGTSTAVIFPQFINGIASLTGGNATLSADAEMVNTFNVNLVSTGTLNGLLDMIHSVTFSPEIDRRITQGGDIRITEEGDFRTITGRNALGETTLTANATITPFAENLYAKNGGIWKAVTPFIYRNGAWVRPVVYVKDNDTWKRVY